MKSRPPILHDVVVPLAVLTPATAFVLALPLLGCDAVVAAVLALAAAIVVGCPLLALALRQGWTKWYELAGLGLVAGAMPLLLWGAVVAVMDGNARPSFAFIVFVLLAGATGAATGGEYWLLFLRPAAAGRGAVLGAAVVPILALTIASLPRLWPVQTWPRHRVEGERLALSWSFGSASDETGTREVTLWSDAAPRCVASVYLPALAARLEREKPAVVHVDVTRIAEEWGRIRRTRIERIHSIDIPDGPLTFIQGCLPWRETRLP